MVNFTYFVALALLCATTASAFPATASLAGLSRDEADAAIASLKPAPRQPPPGPLAFSGTKLIYDSQHPYKAPGRGDIRGPCPALNALASHGYINHNGIATPADVAWAVMEGFNMERNTAVLTTYAAFIVDGNLITNLLSIGGPTPLTGPQPPRPATAGGLSTHGVFEGDTSMTRQDAYLGSNQNFDEGLFQEFVLYSNKYGGGKYNLTAASELRFRRFQDSIARNPQFSIVAPRFFTAYNDAVLPVNLWVDGRQDDGQLDLDVARTFFQDGRFPKDFHRAARPTGTKNNIELFNAHPIKPGRNVRGVNTYTPDLSTPQKLDDPCAEYSYQATKIVPSLYPHPNGPLLDALKDNLKFMYSAVKDAGCTELFPYGK